jgi:uncharacterized Zn-binding protein involved in type VI secretion
MLPSARSGEECLCPAHGLGVIDKSAQGSVETNGRGQARGGDSARCACGPIDFLVTGSGSVTVNSQPAARMSDKTMHRGVVTVGSGDVVIGGPTVGATLGNPAASTKECAALAASRHTVGSVRQGYGNCGVESWRSAINRVRASRGEPPLTEDELLGRAIDIKAARGPIDDIANRKYVGATSAPDRVRILADRGIEATVEPPDHLDQYVAEGRGVSASVYPYWYWPDWSGAKPDWSHEVLITGVEYDENGKVSGYILNDTGLGRCGLRVSAADFSLAQQPRAGITVTKAPLP